MVKAREHVYLFVARIKTVGKLFGRSEIKSRAFDALYFAVWHTLVGVGSVKAAVHLKGVRIYRSYIVTVKVEIGVVGHVENRVGVRCALIMDLNGIVLGESICDLYVYIAGKSLFSVVRKQCEYKARLFGIYCLRVPNL